MVVDASAAIEWLLQTQKGSVIEAQMFSKGQTLHAPHLLDIEVTQVLRRYARERAVTEARAGQLLQNLVDLRILRHRHTFLLRRAWQLRHHLTVYDAVYVALAEALDAPLLTCDAKIAAAPGHHATVEVV
ncbi:MAG: type II toxin-antitoxin system VapC family toxin [Terriglobales bacterium]